LTELSGPFLVEFLQKLFYGIVALNALFAAAVWCVVALNARSLSALVVCAVIWPFVNGPLEGNIIVRIDGAHGITVSDLLTVIALLLAVIKFRQMRARRDGQRGTDADHRLSD
jgi:hypothetical protein